MKIINLILVSLIAISFNSFAQEAHKEHKKTDMKCCTTSKEQVSKTSWNKVCPVRGEQVDQKSNKAEYKGKTYGFCCNGCDKKFMKEPAKFSANLSKDGKTFTGVKEKD